METAETTADSRLTSVPKIDEVDSSSSDELPAWHEAGNEKYHSLRIFFIASFQKCCSKPRYSSSFKE